ncbi:MAG: S-layer homology domain-containing protein, partial [Oscillospiraceae bacterium]|nr:S-layer homology domain-containing protein [Oscillospiraceae bacterium]
MNGVGNNRFNPNGDTSRAMVVTMLWRMENSPAVNYAMSFSDVESDTWYTEAVRWANAEGVVEGDGG